MILSCPARNLTVLVAAALSFRLWGQEPPDAAAAQKILADATEYAAHHERDHERDLVEAVDFVRVRRSA